MLGVLVLVWRHWLPLLGAIGFGVATLTAFVISTTPGGFFGVHEQWVGIPVWLSAISEIGAIVLGVAALAGGTPATPVSPVEGQLLAVEDHPARARLRLERVGVPQLAERRDVLVGVAGGPERVDLVLARVRRSAAAPPGATGGACPSRSSCPARALVSVRVEVPQVRERRRRPRRCSPAPQNASYCSRV